ncbi:GGDEF domain-containing protein [Aquihabitans sp. G128]|uniref:GGDEF domain-containing protein n=1 Tax=Aquihabitans sp. G128 TaxID=2849779 RepID=UPI001C21555B|nr:GGDEF domain-containing protein [Aquihabitans sp. G128]QXC62584.1 GGDEF domain-containing protein [Aquihabitans sp. G128]
MDQQQAALPRDPTARSPLLAGLTPYSVLGDLGTLAVLVFLGLAVYGEVSRERWAIWTLASVAVVAVRHTVSRANQVDGAAIDPRGRSALVFAGLSFALGAWVSAFWIFVAPRDDAVLLGVVLVATVVWWTTAATILAALPLSFLSLSASLWVGPTWVGLSDEASAWNGRVWMLGLLLVAMGAIYVDRRRSLLRLVRTGAELDARAAELALAFETMSDGVLVTTGPHIVRTNRAAAALLRRPVEEIRGETLASLLGAGAAALEVGAPAHVEVLRRDGSERVLEVEGRTGPGSEITVWVCRDVTDQAAKEAEIRDLIERDDLTGLVNRRAMLDGLDRSLGQGPVVVLVVDVDDFKGVNDAHGHRVGDEVLEAVARRLVDLVGSHGTVARPGGDEFVVVATAPEVGDGTTLAEAIVVAGRSPVVVDGHPLAATLSVGVAQGARYADRPTLLHRADLAMYQAKRDGRDAWRSSRPLAGGPPPR